MLLREQQRVKEFIKETGCSNKLAEYFLFLHDRLCTAERAIDALKERDLPEDWDY